jgi:hypothetical protein
MMVHRKFLAPAAAAVAFAVAAPAAAQVSTPPQGSELRKDILDVVRLETEAMVGAPVEFVVDTMNVLGEWAFVEATPQRPGGGAIPYVYSRYQPAVDAGAFDDEVIALVRNTPAGWLVYEYSLGATDVVWLSWIGLYPAPIDIFPPTGGAMPMGGGVPMPAK